MSCSKVSEYFYIIHNTQSYTESKLRKTNWAGTIFLQYSLQLSKVNCKNKILSNISLEITFSLQLTFSHKIELCMIQLKQGCFFIIYVRMYYVCHFRFLICKEILKGGYLKSNLNPGGIKVLCKTKSDTVHFYTIFTSLFF